MRGAAISPVVIAAGGTGGHFFPAEALAAELLRRNHRIVLMTDARSGAHQSPVFQGRDAYVLQGAGIAGRGLGRGLRAALSLAAGTAQARTILATLDAAVVVGFGGYPSVPPILAARTLRRRPRLILHEQNAVLGRANRLLAPLADRLALGMAETKRLPRRTPFSVTGNPVRPGIASLAHGEYQPPPQDGPIRLLVTGGSQGARVFSDAMPAAIGLLPPGLRARLQVAQQCRPEDLERVRAAYAAIGLAPDLSAFFQDMPQRLAAAHFVVARAGASTVAELTTAGRPALLVPLPGSIDGHQRANAAACHAAVLEQAEFEGRPAILAEALAHWLDHPDLLDIQAHAMAADGIADAAVRLADLVEATVKQGVAA